MLITEREQALLLANAILDRNFDDPDDDLAILARQLLRRTEELEAYKAAYLERVTPNPSHAIRRGSS